MIKLKTYDTSFDYIDWTVFFEARPAYVQATASTSFTYRPFLKVKVSVDGTGFRYGKKDKPKSGTIDSITLEYKHDVILKITNLDLSLKKFYNKVMKKKDGHLILPAMLKDGVKIEGDKGGEILPPSPAAGDDIISAGAGDDVINGDRGADRIDGGDGFDVLLYLPTYAKTSAPYAPVQGIVLDATIGEVIDPWGDIDTISGIEGFNGTLFDDVIRGSGANEQFVGYRGNDIIEGRGGWDVLSYAADADFGGKRGIDADLSTGRVKDGFGTVDTVSGIEQIIGTMYDDILIGTDGDQVFAPLGGSDYIDGGPGDHDLVTYQYNERFDAPKGVAVDLSTSAAFDGFYGTQTLIGIEDVIGSSLRDYLTGDGNDNSLDGGGGSDELTGLGGHDVLKGGKRGDNFVFRPVDERFETADSDTVLDFNVKEADCVTIFAADLSEYNLAPAHFASGSAATTPEQRVIYDKSSGRLYYDYDGSGPDAKILLATFANKPDLSPSNIFIGIEMSP